MSSQTSRKAREWKTLQSMIALYCADAHHTTGGELCKDCMEVSEYAQARLKRCPFGEDKPTCAHCEVHCYQPAMRQRVKMIMRTAGPRMLLRHPVLTLQHWIDGRKKTPPNPRKK